ncbi:MAG TPA: RNA ligase partner protein [Thermodesulfobacteriota bacterium]|nr:RNA ligase partner protein [Thermodesulfobacteriota bacterium]
MADQKTTPPNNNFSEQHSKTESIQPQNDTHIPPPAVLHPRLVLDTSLFVNPDAQRQFGENVNQAVNRFLKITRENNIEIYMPLSVFRELSNFTSPEALITFRRDAIVRAPDLYNLQVPAAIFHIFIGELRNRINKGLRITEEAIHKEPTAENIRRLRQEYREALRSGMVDSVEDLDVVLLAKEIGGAVLSADEGIANMAEALGIEVLSATYFIHRYGAE